MKKGFTYGVAPALVAEIPGMTFLEIAELALRRGLCKSDSAIPARSLASTLAKEIREGRHRTVRAQRVGGVLRCYPVSGGQATGPEGRSPVIVVYDEIVSIRLRRDHVEIADLLVEAGKYKTRSEALAWLVAEGILNNQPRVEKVRNAVRQIRTIKESLAL